MTRSNYSNNLDRQTPDADETTDVENSLDAQIAQVWSLEDGWQGPDSRAPSAEAKEFYEIYRDGLPSSYWNESTPSATVDGGLHLQWERSDHTYSADILPGGELVLQVTAPHEADNAELRLDRPTAGMLRRFVMRGLPIE
jgi:hypothetical protein